MKNDATFQSSLLIASTFITLIISPVYGTSKTQCENYLAGLWDKETCWNFVSGVQVRNLFEISVDGKL